MAPPEVRGHSVWDVGTYVRVCAGVSVCQSVHWGGGCVCWCECVSLFTGVCVCVRACTGDGRGDVVVRSLQRQHLQRRSRQASIVPVNVSERVQ